MKRTDGLVMNLEQDALQLPVAAYRDEVCRQRALEQQGAQKEGKEEEEVDEDSR